MANKAVILVNADNASVDTNGVHIMTILQSLYNVIGALSRKLTEEAEQAVGSSTKAQEAYLDILVERYWTKLRNGKQDVNLN